MTSDFELLQAIQHSPAPLGRSVLDERDDVRSIGLELVARDVEAGVTSLDGREMRVAHGGRSSVKRRTTSSCPSANFWRFVLGVKSRRLGVPEPKLSSG
jgi:hypothetical protein